MIKVISDNILKYLIKSEVIDDSKECSDYYRYGLEITISSILNIVLILLVGIISNNFFESVTFLICFIPLRQFTGGYHADTYLKCNLSFMLLFSVLLLIYNITFQFISFYAEFAMLVLSMIIFITECPVENKNKPLTDKQKKKNNHLAVILGLFYGVIGVILKVLSYSIGVIFIYTLVLISLLIIVAKLQKIRKEE